MHLLRRSTKTIRTPLRRGGRAHNSRRGLTLLEFLAALIVGIGLTTAFWRFGAEVVFSAFRTTLLLLAVIVLWGAIYSRAPEMTRNVTALAFVAFLVIGLVPMLALQSREAARRTQCKDNLRRMGQRIQDTFDAPNSSAHGRRQQESVRQ